MMFYLGTHKPAWLGQTAVPLFVSRRTLAGRRQLPLALGRWALDSGGFTELSLLGGWRTHPKQYARDVERFAKEIGGLDWAAPQDWMCEPAMLAKTGLDVQEHQRRTIENYLVLRNATPHVIPVLQGWAPHEYVDHVEQYARAGVALESEPIVGLGTICRRQNMAEAGVIVRSLAGLRLHGFGVKLNGLQRFGDALDSADSMAWSLDARRSPPRRGCRHRSCANCLPYALAWRGRVVGRLRQEVLSLEA